MSEDKKYSPQEVAKAVLSKAYEILKKEKESKERCEPTKDKDLDLPGMKKDEHVKEKVKEIKGPKKLNEVMEETPKHKRKKVLEHLREKKDKMKKCGEMRKAKKVEKCGDMKKSEDGIVKLYDFLAKSYEKKEKGVHKPDAVAEMVADMGGNKGASRAGMDIARYNDDKTRNSHRKEMAREDHKKVLSEMKEMPKPNLPKSEDASKKEKLKEKKKKMEKMDAPSMAGQQKMKMPQPPMPKDPKPPGSSGMQGY